MSALKIGDAVIASVTKRGYYTTSYNGIIAGFTTNGRIKVSSWRGIKCHASHNVKLKKS